MTCIADVCQRPVWDCSERVLLARVKPATLLSCFATQCRVSFAFCDTVPSVVSFLRHSVECRLRFATVPSVVSFLRHSVECRLRFATQCRVPRPVCAYRPVMCRWCRSVGTLQVQTSSASFSKSPKPTRKTVCASSTSCVRRSVILTLKSVKGARGNLLSK